MPPTLMSGIFSLVAKGCTHHLQAQIFDPLKLIARSSFEFGKIRVGLCGNFVLRSVFAGQD
jgi:hypothetical protein